MLLGLKEKSMRKRTVTPAEGISICLESRILKQQRSSSKKRPGLYVGTYCWWYRSSSTFILSPVFLFGWSFISQGKTKFHAKQLLWIGKNRLSVASQKQGLDKPAKECRDIKLWPGEKWHVRLGVKLPFVCPTISPEREWPTNRILKAEVWKQYQLKASV